MGRRLFRAPLSDAGGGRDGAGAEAIDGDPAGGVAGGDEDPGRVTSSDERMVPAAMAASNCTQSFLKMFAG